MSNTLLITSLTFGSLGSRRGVYTVKDLKEELESSSQHEADGDRRVVLGQVFSQAEIDSLHALVPQITVDSDRVLEVLEAENYKHVHKKNPRNGLISTIKSDDAGHHCYLLVPHGNDMVADHVTGEHISGMVLVEAARQMSMAVIDSVFDDDKKRYQIISKMEVDFNTFIHPFETSLHMRFNEFVPKGEKCWIDCEIDFVQAGEVKTTVKLAGTAATMDFARKLEDISVTKYLKKLRSKNITSQKVENVA